jgi:hypothetical protein
LRRRLLDAGTLQKFHYRHVDAKVYRDPILQLDRHQRVQSQVAERLMYVQPGRGEPKHASYLLTQVRLQ